MATEKVAYELSLRDLMTKGLQDINANMAKLETKLGSIEKTGQKSVNTLGNAFKSLGGIISGIAIGAFIKDTVLVTAKFQSLGNSIKFASDNAVQGELSMNWLASFSKQWGLDLEGAAEGFRTFQGAMMKTKFTSNEVRTMFGQVSMGIVAMGLSADQAKGVFLALGQMQSKGKISAEELRGQLGERLPGAMAIMARATGHTVAELDDLMRTGQLLSEDVLPKFAAEMEKTFGSGAVDNAGSMASNINRLSNSWLELRVAMGESQGGFINTVLESASGWLDVIANQFRDINQMAGRSSGENTINILAAMENEIKNKSTMMQSTGASKGDIEKSLTGITGQAKESWAWEISSLQDKIKSIEGEKINQKRATSAAGVLGFDEAYSSKEGLYKGDKEYAKLYDQLTSLKKASEGLQGITDKEVSNLYAPKTMSKEEKKKLKEASESVSGGVPKVVNINIEALMKDIKNYFGSTATAITEAQGFLGQLEQALMTIVTDTAIASEYGH